MSNNSEIITVLDEPELEFGFGQKTIDPRDGLSLFGPFSQGNAAEHPSSPSYLVLGTKEGIELWSAWAAAMNKPSAFADTTKHRLWPPYPGYEVAFGNPWTEQPAKTVEISRSSLSDASNKRDSHERCFAVVQPYIENIQKFDTKLDNKISLAICVIPDDVWQNCRPESRISSPVDVGLSKQQKMSRKAGQLELFQTFDPEQYQLSPDFRRQLKARSMKFGIPLQIIRESTLRLSDENKKGERGLTPVSDRMWNLSTAIYYKCGGKPWRLSSIREGVSYVGIAFRKTEGTSQSACCVAQMFLASGDGIVFLGDEGPWYSEKDHDFHLPAAAAEKLLKGVLETYATLAGITPLTEIFLHCRSSINDAEYAGYLKACPAGSQLVAIRVRHENAGLRLFRTGKMPVLRGTLWKQNERSAYLFGVGFKPRLATYDGWEVPVPMRIDIQHGTASIDVVAQDIFALTKLNYNACRLGESQPVTVGFSDAVGEILLANPTITDRRPNFKYYI